MMESLPFLEPTLGGFLALMLPAVLLALVWVAPRRGGGRAGRGTWISAGVLIAAVALGYLFAAAWPFLLVAYLTRGR